MTHFKKLWCLPAVLWCCCVSLQAQPSVLHTGDWYKLEVERTGIFSISYDLLRKMGVEPGRINPQHIKIFGLTGGMLPQPNSIPRPSDLQELAIEVVGETDGRFDRGDRILFYAEGADRVEYDVARDIFLYENNLYSDKNFYFLNVGSDPGKRITVSENIAGSFPVVNAFTDCLYYENDQYNIERSGREWFGEKFTPVTSYTVTFKIPGITQGSTLKVVSAVLGQSYTNASFKVYFNNALIAEQNISPIPNGRYSVKGTYRRDTVAVNAGDVSAPGREAQELKYEFIKGSGFSQGYLDYVMLNVNRNLALYGDQTIFTSRESMSNAVSTFEVKGLTNDSRIWEVTDHYNVRSQQFSLSGDGGTFSSSTAQLKKWAAFNAPAEPIFVSRIDNQNLSALATPNLLIITHRDFRAEAERLAQHRRGFSNWSAEVVTTEEIYNQFSSGRQDVSALRDFARLLWEKDPTTLRAILLFGKSSYDYKDRLPNNTNFVPTYQSRNSLHPLQTYSSDDYFTFLESGEGTWSESPAQHHTLDVGVGRIPVTSAAEARNVVDKIIDYDTNQKRFGSWRKKVVFVADDGNSEDDFTSLHQYQADQLATYIEENYPAFDARRLFMGSYKKNVQPNGETAPLMADDLKRTFDQGAVIINFTGHGSELVWTDERILTEKTVEELSNEHYPFLVTATCEFGRQDDPLLISTAERSLTKQGGGSIGLVTTARPVNATTNFDLNQAFYESLFQRSSFAYLPIGEVFRSTKNNSSSGVSNRNFSLIGDPSMVLALPAHAVRITSIETSFGSDTLKALSTVTARGEVLDDSTRSIAFNGVVECTLYDKEKQFITIGKNDPPFEYWQWDNAVFRGKATVTNGEFELTFVMPKNIAYQVGQGKLSLYAFDPEREIEAKGVHVPPIGGSENDVAPDNTPPGIRLFMGDTTFVDGGVTTPDTYLIALLEDENGINISGYGIGNSIIAQLDVDGATYVLSDYYVSDLDTHKRGTITFPILGLAPGRHSLTVKAWDVYNNPSTATIEFIVTDAEELLIETFGSFPNPFQQSTTLFFTHNRSGDDLRAQISIYSLAGELVKSAEISVTNGDYYIDLMQLDASDVSGKKLAPGLYLARLLVRSLNNGSKNERVTKLILLN